jgi:hypothetical protein
MKHRYIKTDATPIYHDFEDGRFYINSPSCVVAFNQIVQVGKVYLFSEMQESVTKLLLVRLLNVRFDAGLVHLHLKDILTSRIIDAHQVVGPESTKCTWMLLDMDYFNEKLHKKKYDHSTGDDTLLEFEF